MVLSIQYLFVNIDGPVSGAEHRVMCGLKRQAATRTDTKQQSTLRQL